MMMMMNSKLVFYLVLNYVFLVPRKNSENLRIYRFFPRKFYEYVFGGINNTIAMKGQVRSYTRSSRTRSRRVCMIRCMNGDKARRVCKDRNRWRSMYSFCLPIRD